MVCAILINKVSVKWLLAWFMRYVKRFLKDLKIFMLRKITFSDEKYKCIFEF